MKTDLAAIVALQELRVGVEMDSAYDPMSSEKLAALDAAIAALHSQAQEREGWVLVPKVATAEMFMAQVEWALDPSDQQKTSSPRISPISKKATQP